MQKTDTINRLLKKQVGRQKSKLSTVSTPQDSGPKPLASARAAQLPMLPAIPTRYHYLSSTKSGEYVALLGIPVVDMTERRFLAGQIAPAEIVYPGPRPPLKTRRFAKA